VAVAAEVVGGAEVAEVAAVAEVVAVAEVAAAVVTGSVATGTVATGTAVAADPGGRAVIAKSHEKRRCDGRQITSGLACDHCNQFAN
jgi:hypothetical protein